VKVSLDAAEVKQNSDDEDGDSENEESKQAVAIPDVKRFTDFKNSILSIARDDYSDIARNIQDEKHVEFDLSASTTYVISGMGSGKST